MQTKQIFLITGILLVVLITLFVIKTNGKNKHNEPVQPSQSKPVPPVQPSQSPTTLPTAPIHSSPQPLVFSGKYTLSYQNLQFKMPFYMMAVVDPNTGPQIQNRVPESDSNPNKYWVLEKVPNQNDDIYYIINKNPLKPNGSSSPNNLFFTRYDPFHTDFYYGPPGWYGGTNSQYLQFKIIPIPSKPDTYYLYNIYSQAYIYMKSRFEIGITQDTSTPQCEFVIKSETQQ